MSQMPTGSATKTLTVRLRPEVYAAAFDVARARSVSLNTLVQEGILSIIHDAEEQSRYDAYTLLGDDPDGCSVEYAFAVQAEVALSDEN
jgi:hypothetical protein